MPKSEIKDTLTKLHKVQWEIIQTMTKKEHSRFNEIKPKEMDPKRFMYHLNRLQLWGLVDHDKKSGRYTLTDRAKLLIVFYKGVTQFEEFPVFTYILLYIKKSDTILVVKRSRAPYLGFTGNPFFSIKKDSYHNDSAKQALNSLKLSGALSLNLILDTLYKKKDGSVKLHANIYIYFIDNPKGTPPKKIKEGKLIWMKPQKLIAVKKGYDNSEDIVKFFENKKFDKTELKILSKTYYTPW